jgi:uncharacterized phage infection (PIP) family protein YhgE
MNNNTDPNTDTIIDLDPDQVIENTEKSSEMGTPTRRTSRKRNWLYLGVALLAAALGGGWLYKDVLSAYLPSDQMRGLTDKVAILESGNAILREQLGSVDKLAAQLKSDIDAMEAKDAEFAGLAEAAQKSQASTADKMAALEQGLGETKQALAELASRPTVAADGTAVAPDAEVIAALTQRIDSLEKDVASLKVKPTEMADSRAALSQGLSDLKAKIAAGTGYRDEYERIQRMVPAASGLDVLQQHAALGLPDAKGLAGELRGLIGYLPKPIVPGPVPESQSWWAGIYNSLSDLITIKVEGDVDWPSAASAAAALADSGDLPQAIEQLTKIEGAKPGGVQQWIDRANARLALEAALKSVEDAVLRVIAAKG